MWSLLFPVAYISQFANSLVLKGFTESYRKKSAYWDFSRETEKPIIPLTFAPVS